jgi:hypothetical protein
MCVFFANSEGKSEKGFSSHWIELFAIFGFTVEEYSEIIE